MPIEANCPGCGCKLHIASEHVAQTARCPRCNALFTVPVDGTDPSSKTKSGEPWHLKTPEGQVYGPVTREVLNQWVYEGRVSDECRLLCESTGIWQEAATVYPILRPVPRGVTQRSPLSPPWTGEPSIPAPSSDAGSPVRIVNAHRGGIVLALGVLSWAVGCPIFGVMAWVMGSNDLRDMRQGMMDTSGMGLTQAGQVIGMIHVILSLLALVFGLFLLLAMGFVH